MSLPRRVRSEHCFDRADVVLEVRVDGDHHVALGREQPGEKRVLVSAVARKLDARMRSLRPRAIR